MKVKVDYVERARALVGTRFRLQGRGPEGLDCVGVAVAAFNLPTEAIRRDYRLRGDHELEVRSFLARDFRRVSKSQMRPGDLMLMRVSNDQLHLGVRTAAGFVHAHAGLRRVVETPGMPEWPLLGTYRRRRA
jgi:murein DD-endopeptidase / murein LD-carboxypeptidase